MSIWTAARVRVLIHPYVGDRIPFITFFFAVAVAARFGGLGPGLVSAGLSLPASSQFVLSLEEAVLPKPPGGWIGFLFFVAVSGAIVYFSHQMRSSRERSERNAQRFLRERERCKFAIPLRRFRRRAQRGTRACRRRRRNCRR